VSVDQPRNGDGTFAVASFEAIYDALEREVKRIDQLRAADQLAVAAALSAAEKAVAAALSASKEAVNKAEEAQLRTNTGQNEFRQQLKDQAATLASITELHSIESTLREADERLLASINDLRSRLDVGPPSLGVLQARSDQQQGRDLGTDQSWLRVIAAMGVLIGVVGIVLAVLKL
jgi:hypothetical protein